MFKQLRRDLLDRWAHLVCEHPLKVLLTAALLAAAAVAVTVSQLGFQANRNDLLSDSLEWNQRHIRYMEQFQGQHELIGVVRVPDNAEAGAGAGDGLAEAQAFVDRLAQRLRADDTHVQQVWDRVEPEPILMRLLPLEQFEQRVAELLEAGPLLEAENVSGLLADATASLAAQEDADDPGTVEDAVGQIEQLSELVGMIERALRGELDGADLGADDDAAALPPAAQRMLGGAEPDQYLASDDGRLLFISIEPRVHAGELDPFERAVRAVREHIRATQQQMPHIEAGLTGIAVMEADEASVLIEDSTLASALAIVAIVVLLIVAFHGWRAPLLMVIALGVGVAWSFGVLTLAVGHLQLLSVFFTVILLGLGIDYGIHLISRFELVRHHFPDGRAGARMAMADTMQRTGPGIVSGAAMTAVAFSVTLLTDFRGMAEMGLIASMGVLLCVFAMLTVLPALLVLLHNAHRNIPAAEVRAIDLHAQDWLMPMVRRPGLTVGIAAVPVLLAAIAGPRVDYDHNLMNLYPQDLESVQWLHVVMEHEREAVWSAVSVTENLAEARELTAAYRQLEEVDGVGGIGMLFPESEREKLIIAAEAKAQLGDALERATPGSSATAEELGQQLQALSVGTAIGAGRREVREQPAVYEALSVLSQRTRSALAAMDSDAFEAAADRRMADLNSLFATIQQSVRQVASEALATRSLRVADLPEHVARRAVSVTEPQRYALHVYPAQNIWDQEHLSPFVAALRRVDAEVTGGPVQIYESGTLIRDSYVFVGVLAFAVVLVLVYLDFLRPVDALLSMTPVTLGFVMMFGWMYVAGVTINPANIIALPLLFGIGIASGVHILHRYQQNRYQRPLGLSAGTGKGVLLTNLTTIIAFASLMVASHRGIRGLGFVISVGVAMTLLACLTVLPALLELRNRYHVMRRRRQWNQAANKTEA